MAASVLGVAVGAAACDHEFHPPDRSAIVAEAEAEYSEALFDSVSWTSQEARVQEGNAIYAEDCRRCHGSLGSGVTDYARERGLEVPSLVAPDWDLDDLEALRHEIYVGHETGMPVFGEGASPSGRWMPSPATSWTSSGPRSSKTLDRRGSSDTRPRAHPDSAGRGVASSYLDIAGRHGSSCPGTGFEIDRKDRGLRVSRVEARRSAPDGDISEPWTCHDWSICCGGPSAEPKAPPVVSCCRPSWLEAFAEEGCSSAPWP